MFSVPRAHDRCAAYLEASRNPPSREDEKHTDTEALKDHQRGCYQIWTDALGGFQKSFFWIGSKPVWWDIIVVGKTPVPRMTRLI